MKVLLARLFEPRYPARYIGRHRAPSVVLLLSSARQSRADAANRVAASTL